MDWDVLQAHETGIASTVDGAGEELLEGAHVVKVYLIALETAALPVASFSMMRPAGAFRTDWVLRLQFLYHVLLLIIRSRLEARTVLDSLR